MWQDLLGEGILKMWKMHDARSLIYEDIKCFCFVFILLTIFVEQSSVFCRWRRGGWRRSGRGGAPCRWACTGTPAPGPVTTTAARRLHAPSETQFTRIDIRDILSLLAEKQKKNILAEKQKNILAWHTGLAPKQHAYSLLLCSHSRHSCSHISCRN